MSAGLPALTAKEKEALRLLGQGHDAKSIARHLGLSVHTIHERLRDARRKLGVSSSREAARLLRNIEGPEFFGDTALGADAAPAPAQPDDHQPERRSPRPVWLMGGTLMSIMLVALALAFAAPDAALQPDPAVAAADAPAIAAARDFLALTDAEDWNASWKRTGKGIHAHNSLATWTKVSQSLRARIGTPGKRELLTVDQVPAPPNGYTVIKFRTDYSRKPGAIETLSLAREGDAWRITGITID